jgi:hypothetical protein
VRSHVHGRRRCLSRVQSFRVVGEIQHPGSGNRGDVSAGWLPDDVASIDEEVDAGHE